MSKFFIAGLFVTIVLSVFPLSSSGQSQEKNYLICSDSSITCGARMQSLTTKLRSITPSSYPGCSSYLNSLSNYAIITYNAIDSGNIEIKLDNITTNGLTSIVDVGILSSCPGISNTYQNVRYGTNLMLKWANFCLIILPLLI